MTFQDALLKTPQRGQIRREEFEQEQIRRHGARYTEYRKHYDAAGRFEYEPAFPLYLMLEQTFHCNLRCPMCIQGLPARRSNYEPDVSQMSRALFEQIVLEGEAYGCPSISMHVNDEPLLVKDLPERIAFASTHGFMDIIMTTNGVLLTEEKARHIIEAGLTHILFSVDAATPQTYDKIRIGGDYPKVLRAMEAVQAIRASRHTALPLTRASFVQNRLNEHETADFLRKFAELVDYVEIQGFSSYYDQTTHLVPSTCRPVDDFACSEPWRKLIVRANGDVLPCCSFYGYDIVLGNLRETSLCDLFQSERMKSMRREFQLKIYRNPACLACSKSFYEPAVALS